MSSSYSWGLWGVSTPRWQQYPSNTCWFCPEASLICPKTSGRGCRIILIKAQHLLECISSAAWVSFFLIPASCWFSVPIKGRGRRNSADQLTRHQNSWFAGPIGRMWTIYAKSSSSEGLPRILNLIVELMWAFFFLINWIFMVLSCF